jgi:hypothetical protein
VKSVRVARKERLMWLFVALKRDLKKEGKARGSANAEE